MIRRRNLALTILALLLSNIAIGCADEEETTTPTQPSQTTQDEDSVVPLGVGTSPSIQIQGVGTSPSISTLGRKDLIEVLQ